MEVTNKTYIKMPLQYMCHMNYAYFDGAQFVSNMPESAFKLRESIPAHIHPTKQWYAYTKKLIEEQKDGKIITVLDNKPMYDPEIVYMADDLSVYGEDAVFEMKASDITCFTQYKTSDFKSATRWIMYNDDLQVAAFVLPATCRPEGAKAAERMGTIIYLEPNETKTFHVQTGLR